MATKSELKKKRKEAIKEIPYQNVYVDGVIETRQGCFTKTYIVNNDIMKIFDMIGEIYNSQDENLMQKVDSQLTYFQSKYYLTLGIDKPTYEEAVEAFKTIDGTSYLQPMSLVERLSLLHTMYQNDDNFVERFVECSYYKKDTKASLNPFSPNYPVVDKLKNFKRNKKISKDLIIPMMMKASSTEMEFESNYIRFFYLKNMPRYITKEFFTNIENIQDTFFSLHFRPTNQQKLVQFVEDKYDGVKDLKESELVQKQFFENAKTELLRSAKRGETMFLITLVFGMYDDSIDELNDKMKLLVRELECSYVVKELRFQQKAAFETFLPFANDKLDIQTTAYKAKVKMEVGK